jgi:EAL domain-containing protein (putative c-di-GMP-specific phosphodiesterase class I)
VQILEETEFPAHRLELEITESVLLSSDETAVEVVQAVRGMGVSIALDDFGTGYSGLAYLNRFMVDRIKIDASFVQEVQQSIAAQSIIGTMISLARERGLEVTVEGVENTDQVVFLTRFGKLCYQGFLFSRPMPFEDFVQSPTILLVEGGDRLNNIPIPPAQPGISLVEQVRRRGFSGNAVA